MKFKVELERRLHFSSTLIVEAKSRGAAREIVNEIVDDADLMGSDDEEWANGVMLRWHHHCTEITLGEAKPLRKAKPKAKKRGKGKRGKSS